MGYTLKTNLANKNNYGSKRSLSSIIYIVLHFTANDGDTDENNGNYFKNNIVEASAHYFVDDDSVTQSVPDDYVAWSVGGSKYASCTSTGGGKHHNRCTNDNSISIEICDDVPNGVIYPSAKTIENTLELTKSLMKKYGIDADHVIRHFDVTGKLCPAYWCGTSANNEKWLTEFHNKLTVTVKEETSNQGTKELYRVRKSWDDPKSQKGAYTNLDGAKECADDYPGYSVYNRAGNAVYTSKVDGSFKVRIKIEDLNIRTGAGTGYGRVGFAPPGVYTIVDTVVANGYTWGLLKAFEKYRSGWIALEYTEPV